MTSTLSISNLLYEEVVMLQNILWYTANHTNFCHELDATNREIFDDLYEKVINS